MVCVLTSAYTASPWCTAELGIAQSRGNLALPVRAEPEASHPLLLDVGHPVRGHHRGRWCGPRQANAALLRLDAAGGRGWPDGRSRSRAALVVSGCISDPAGPVGSVEFGSDGRVFERRGVSFL